MSAAYRMLLEYWIETERAPCSHSHETSASIEALERRYDIVLPGEFRDYVLAARFSEEFYDNENMSWWGADQIKNIADECDFPIGDPRVEADSSKYLVFADYLHWCCAWAICCKLGDDFGKIALICGQPDRIVSNSFSEFVADYVNDPMTFLNRQFAIQT